MAPVFSPTSPPTMVLLPPKTFPLAEDDEIKPPDRREAVVGAVVADQTAGEIQSAHGSTSKQPSPTVTCTAALEPVMVPMLKPTSPPALRPD